MRVLDSDRFPFGLTKQAQYTLIALFVVVVTIVSIHEKETRLAISMAAVEYAKFFPKPPATDKAVALLSEGGIRLRSFPSNPNILVVEQDPGLVCSSVLGHLIAYGMKPIGADGHLLTASELKVACRGDDRVRHLIYRKPHDIEP
ncbi:hypothetical protein PSQ33_005456 [Pseudomonas aeruginosa]|uniref:hypothetical protein n=1 Tax=Pseudomonas aeruginosa TaxID=287 RepID=UPI00287F87A9|nr:hypothetical protein [Pseudomonas aeruginosa]EKL8566498.1 hypothetical protein [Pseudomonas aeruginosa]MCS7918638.1 hypothetical protein [Pseudomonas aeruginosa]